MLSWVTAIGVFEATALQKEVSVQRILHKQGLLSSEKVVRKCTGILKLTISGSTGCELLLTEFWLPVCASWGAILTPCVSPHVSRHFLGTFNPYSADPLPASPKKQLILKIISGQQLPKPPDSMLGDRGEVRDSATNRCFHEGSWSDMTGLKLSPSLNTPLNFRYCQAFGREILRFPRLCILHVMFKNRFVLYVEGDFAF